MKVKDDYRCGICGLYYDKADMIFHDHGEHICKNCQKENENMSKSLRDELRNIVERRDEEIANSLGHKGDEIGDVLFPEKIVDLIMEKVDKEKK